MSLSWQDFWGPADLINYKHISWLITIPVMGGGGFGLITMI